MKMTVDIIGHDKLLRKLKSLPKKIAEEHLEKATLEGAEIIREEASNRAPRRTGKLATNIITEVEEKTKTSITAKVGPAKEVFYGLFLERGTSKMRARPFLRPAIDEKKDAAEKTVINVLKRRLGL